MRQYVYGLTFTGIDGARQVNLIGRRNIIRDIDVASFDFIFKDHTMLAAMVQLSSLLSMQKAHKIFSLGAFMADALDDDSCKYDLEHWKEVYSWSCGMNPFRSYILFKMSQINEDSDIDNNILEEAATLENWFSDICNFIWARYITGSDLCFEDGHWFIINNKSKKEITIDHDFFYKNILHRMGYEKEGRIFYDINLELFICLSSITRCEDFGVILCI